MLGTTKTLVHAFVSSHLDYCHALLFGLPKYQLDRPQKVQNAAARVVFQLSKFDHIMPALVDLHWLPLEFRVQFKLLLIVFKSLHNQTPDYINDLLSMKTESNYSLRSSSQFLLSVPRVNCSTFGGHAFTHAAPVLWNSLPLTIKSSSIIFVFKKRLKTFLFKKALKL